MPDYDQGFTDGWDAAREAIVSYLSSEFTKALFLLRNDVETAEPAERAGWSQETMFIDDLGDD